MHAAEARTKGVTDFIVDQLAGSEHVSTISEVHGSGNTYAAFYFDIEIGGASYNVEVSANVLSDAELVEKASDDCRVPY